MVTSFAKMHAAISTIYHDYNYAFGSSLRILDSGIMSGYEHKYMASFKAVWVISTDCSLNI